MSYNMARHTDSFGDDFERLLKALELKISFKISFFVLKILASAKKANAFNENTIKASLRFTKKVNLSIPLMKQ